MLKIFHSPGSCSNGILYLLNELGAAYELIPLIVAEGQQNTPEYVALNPKRKVPALVLPDGQVLTEYPVIAQYLARSFPEAGLWPDDMMAQLRLAEVLDYMVATVHMRAFTFVLVPKRFAPRPEMQQVLYDYGLSEVAKGLDVLSGIMGDRDYLMGDFSIADSALFFLLDWAEQRGIAMPDNLAACYARLKARPAYAKTAPNLVRHR